MTRDRQPSTNRGRGAFGLFLSAAAALMFLAACAGPAGEEAADDAGVEPDVETFMVGDIEVRTDGLSARDAAHRSDEITFELEPAGFVEYKYRLEEGEPMVYSWESSGPVRSEMHAEADDQPEGTAEFFEVIESAEAASGVFTAPFAGIHGWYWQNPSEDAGVTVTLRSAGFYSFAMEFRADSRRRYEPAAVTEATAD